MRYHSRQYKLTLYLSQPHIWSEGLVLGIHMHVAFITSVGLKVGHFHHLRQNEAGQYAALRYLNASENSILFMTCHCTNANIHLYFWFVVLSETVLATV